MQMVQRMLFLSLGLLWLCTFAQAQTCPPDLEFDDCGVCNGTNDCVDCMGVPNGGAVVDACDQCNGMNVSCSDCDGVPNGSSVFDACGVCGGDSSTCCHNYLGVPNAIWDWMLLRMAVEDISEKMEGFSHMLACSIHTIPPYDDGKCDGNNDDGREDLERLHVREMADAHMAWYQDCLIPFTNVIPQWSLQISP